jgi:predicted phosphodiesterase
MRYAILADIHANLEAFIEVKKKLKEENIDKYICLGDIVGYGANPKECLSISRKLFDFIVAGNHDQAVAGIFDTSYFNPYAREAVNWTIDVLNQEEKNFLKSLPLTLDIDDNFQIVHASLYRPDEFHYILNLKLAEQNFKLMKKDLCFVGHSHGPVIFAKDEEASIDYSLFKHMHLKNNYSYIVNAGSVGQPRDNNPKACYCIYDNSNNKIEIKRVAYPVKKAQDKIIKAGLPHFLALRLSAGR